MSDTGGTDSNGPEALVDPARMSVVGRVDVRYQAYNVEMVEVTGGRFWKPYRAIEGLSPLEGGAADPSGDTPAGMDPGLYMYRPPLDLTNTRLRALARALGPSYMRVSGTWANTTYFDPDAMPVLEPPEGYGAVLTRDQWLGALEFSEAVDAPLVLSMPVGMGTRDASGRWMPEQAERWLAFTREHGGKVAAVEFFNEPTLAAMGGAPLGYTAAAYGADHRRFEELMRRVLPGSAILAPGSVGEANAEWSVAGGGYGSFELLSADDLMSQIGEADAFSYHHYGAVSGRCAQMGHQTTREAALSDQWLARTEVTLDFYRAVRERWLPGKPIWNTETAESACGANPWAKTFLDTFRYVYQLGSLAQEGVSVVVHNTLAASDYGLLDEDTFAPRPNFWAALLWRRLMGAEVLDPGTSGTPDLHVFAHRSRDVEGGVTVVIINADPGAERAVEVVADSTRYTLTAQHLESEEVELNGVKLELGVADELPEMVGAPAGAGVVHVPPASVTFLTIPGA